MKAAILHEPLVKALGALNRIVPSRGQLPVLANILIEAEKTGVTLSATNLEIGLRMIVGGKVTEEGAITVPARALGEFVASLGAESVALESVGEKLKVSGGRGTGSFAGIAASEFPVLPTRKDKPKEGKTVKLKKKAVVEVAAQVAYAAAVEESRPVLTGVKFYSGEKGFMAVATDGFRLARKNLGGSGDWAGWGEGLILPSRTIIELAKLITEGKKEDLEIEMIKENNQVIFIYDTVSVISRVLEGNFPDVEKIIPLESKTRVTADREELTQAVRSAAIFARESANVVRLKIVGEVMRVTASGQQTGEGEVEIEIEKEGEDGEIAFNYRYMLDVLGSFGGERVRLEMNGSQSPGVWQPEKDSGLGCLIMPVRI
jgi:DNA polymerase-3 subunit beta